MSVLAEFWLGCQTVDLKLRTCLLLYSLLAHAMDHRCGFLHWGRCGRGQGSADRLCHPGQLRARPSVRDLGGTHAAVFVYTRRYAMDAHPRRCSKHVWLSISGDLRADAQRDFRDLGSHINVINNVQVRVFSAGRGLASSCIERHQHVGNGVATVYIN